MYDKVIAIEPKDIDALSNKAIALRNLGKYEEAIGYFEKVLAIDPSNTTTLKEKELTGSLNK